MASCFTKFKPHWKCLADHERSCWNISAQTNQWLENNNHENMEGRKEMFYLTTHLAHFIYGYMASDIWLRTILLVRKETRCHHIGYSFRLAARVLLYAPSHRQDSTYYGLCYTSRGALIGTRNSSVGSPHEGSVQRPIAPWANALTTELHLDPENMDESGAELYRHINGQKVVVHCSVYREERGTDRLLSQHTVKFIVQTIIFK